MRKALLMLAAGFCLAACSGPPKALKPGDITSTPPACEDLRRRGGEC